jgi:hypothetical protein
MIAFCVGKTRAEITCRFMSSGIRGLLMSVQYDTHGKRLQSSLEAA